MKSCARGVGSLVVCDDEDAVASVGCPHGTSRNNKRLDGISDIFKVSADFVEDVGLLGSRVVVTRAENIGLTSHLSSLAGENHCGDATNILTNEPSGPDFVNASKHLRPEVAVILRASSLAGVTERLAGKTAGEDVDVSAPFVEVGFGDIFIGFCVWKPIIKNLPAKRVYLAMEGVLDTEHFGGDLRRAYA